MPDGSNRIPTNLRTLLILEIVGRSEEALSATEINAEIDLPKQTVHRLVSMLEREGFLVRDGRSKKFRPSRRLRLIGAGLLHASRFHITRHQILKEVSDIVRETVNFVVPEDTGMKYLDRVETDWPFRIQLPRGSNVPFHCTASGKAFMASMGKAARRRFVDGLTLTRETANTHPDAARLMADLAEIARRGYALDNEEFMENMVACAVPVTDGTGRFIGALAVHGPKSRTPLQEMERYRTTLLAGAEKLKEALFVEE